VAAHATDTMRRSRECRSRSASTPSSGLRPLLSEQATLPQLALRWILMHDAVSTVIPGARSPDQAQVNAAAAALPALDERTMEQMASVYEQHIAPHVRQGW
jgi:aryl-alcohol dehydrogenase-like predicted oxidoreductase